MKIFSDTIKTLKNTAFHSQEAEDLARVVIAYLKAWFPNFKNTGSGKSIKFQKNRENQNFLFKKLLLVCMLLTTLVDREIGSMEFLTDTYDLLFIIQQYANKALHKISFQTLIEVFSRYGKEEPGTDIKGSLKKEGSLYLYNLSMLATINGNSVTLTPMYEYGTDELDDSEYLEKLARSGNFLSPEDTNRLSRILRQMKKVDQNGEAVDKKDLDAITIIGMNFLLDSIHALIKPEEQEKKMQFLYKESLSEWDFLHDLDICYELQKKNKL